jgi:hypothetical protein
MGSIKLIFGLSVIVVSLYLCVMLVPPYYDNYEFQGEIQSEALYGANNSKPEEAIRDSVYKKAKELRIPITPDDIKVHRVGVNGSGSVSIDVPYVVHVAIPGYPTDLHFDVTVTDMGSNN